MEMNLSLEELTAATTRLREPLRTILPAEAPPKAGLQSAEGQARLLHDLGNIELQAIELGLRTLRDFPAAPAEFRAELEAITREEWTHFQLCLEGIQTLGFSWGHWPVHTQLVDAVAADDSLLERIFIVHCYLEGSGLDAGEILLRRLNGVRDPRVKAIVQRIVNDELKHVHFGVTWFRRLAEATGLDPYSAMADMILDLRHRGRLPARGAAVAREVRLRAGFNEHELELLAEVSRPASRAN